MLEDEFIVPKLILSVWYKKKDIEHLDSNVN